MKNISSFASWCLLCVLGATLSSYARSAAAPMGGNPISSTNWSFECLYKSPCGANGGWLNTTSEPGTVRLWDAGVSWAILNPAADTYEWKTLDTWLDLIAEHQSGAVMYTFGHTPCWISNGHCSGYKWDNWSPSPPTDLSSSGSPSFNAFVKQLTQHCSPAGHCVKDSIQYFEMWNEANQTIYWTGTPSELYDMFKPAIRIVRNNIPRAITSTPAVCGGHADWMTIWMNLENTKGRLSDYYGIHVYMRSSPPETRINMVRRMLATKNLNGWTNAPWMNTETNFINTTDMCSTAYTVADCQGQLVRWHVLQYAMQGTAGRGAFNISWFNWDSIKSGGYDTYYYTMMQWLTGATFTGTCTNTNKGTVWTCPLKEASGATALIVWDAAGRSRYRPTTEYVAYKYFNGTYGGATRSMSPGQTPTIGVQPIMLESAK